MYDLHCPACNMTFCGMLKDLHCTEQKVRYSVLR